MPRPQRHTTAAGLLRALLLSLALIGPAQAGMVGTDEVLADADPQRAALLGALDRQQVAAQLTALGVSAEDARTRVARLTDREVAQLHQRVGALPAGGNLSTVELLLIIILIVLLV